MSRSVSILTGGTNSHTESAANANAVATDFIAQGIVGAVANTAGVAPNTGGMAVNAQGTLNATTQITPGVAYVTGTPSGSTSQTFRCSDPDGATVTHAANATGGTRFDWIYITIDAAKLANPAADASDVFTYTVSRSTSATTDNGTPPTYGYNIAVVTLANGFSTVINGNIADKRTRTGATVTNSSATTGIPVQIVSTNFSAVATGTTTIPFDDTIPQITEGTEFMTQAITPKSSTNDLHIEAVMHCSDSVAGELIAALFQDSTANALAAGSSFQVTATGRTQIVVRHKMTAGTTSETTFRIRGGCESAGTFTFNGTGGARKFGGATLSSIKITEVKV